MAIGVGEIYDQLCLNSSVLEVIKRNLYAVASVVFISAYLKFIFRSMIEAVYCLKK